MEKEGKNDDVASPVAARLRQIKLIEIIWIIYACRWYLCDCQSTRRKTHPEGEKTLSTTIKRFSVGMRLRCDRLRVVLLPAVCALCLLHIIFRGRRRCRHVLGFWAMFRVSFSWRSPSARYMASAWSAHRVWNSRCNKKQRLRGTWTFFWRSECVRYATAAHTHTYTQWHCNASQCDSKLVCCRYTLHYEKAYENIIHYTNHIAPSHALHAGSDEMLWCAWHKYKWYGIEYRAIEYIERSAVESAPFRFRSDQLCGCGLRISWVTLSRFPLFGNLITSTHTHERTHARTQAHSPFIWFVGEVSMLPSFHQAIANIFNYRFSPRARTLIAPHTIRQSFSSDRILACTGFEHSKCGLCARERQMREIHRKLTFQLHRLNCA